MNVDEIVRATRALAVSRDNQCDNDFVLMAGKKVMLNIAADLIESLQAQLAESQRREKAAVEFIKYLDRNYSGYMAEDEKFEQWRGMAAGDAG